MQFFPIALVKFTSPFPFWKIGEPDHVSLVQLGRGCKRSSIKSDMGTGLAVLAMLTLAPCSSSYSSAPEQPGRVQLSELLQLRVCLAILEMITLAPCSYTPAPEQPGRENVCKLG